MVWQVWAFMALGVAAIIVFLLTILVPDPKEPPMATVHTLPPPAYCHSPEEALRATLAQLPRLQKILIIAETETGYLFMTADKEEPLNAGGCAWLLLVGQSIIVGDGFARK